MKCVIIILLLSVILQARCSHFEVPLKDTHGLAPPLPPSTSPQAFESTHYSSMRDVTLYWTNVANFSQLNTANFFYFVTCVNKLTGDEFSSRQTKQPKAVFQNVGSSSYEFRLYSRNNYGLSPDYTPILLPTNEQLLNSPREINVFTSKEVYKVEWLVPTETIPGFTNFTIFWCPAKYYLDDCIGELHWQTLTENFFAIEHTVDLKFAISVNSNTSTSGMTWARCLVEVPIRELYHVFALTQSPISLLVKWQFYCDAQSRVVDTYTLQFCPASNCTHAEMRQATMNTTIGLTQFLLDNLQPSTLYKIIFSSPQIKERYEIYGNTDLGIPEAPEAIRIFYDNQTNLQQLTWSFPSSPFLDTFRIQIGKRMRQIVFEDNFNQTECSAQNRVCVYNLSGIINRFLRPYNVYYLSICSCNVNHICSYPIQWTSFTSPPTVPSQLSNPPVEKLSESAYRVYFLNPRLPNGPISHYLVRQVNTDTNHVQEYTFLGNESHSEISVICHNDSTVNIPENVTFKISVASSNTILETGFNLTSNFSEPTRISLCTRQMAISKPIQTPSRFWSNVFIILGILSIAALVLLLYFTVQFIRNLRHKKKQFNIKIECNGNANSEKHSRNAASEEEEEDTNRHFANLMNIRAGIFSSRYYNVNFDIVLNRLYLSNNVYINEGGGGGPREETEGKEECTP